MDPIVGNGDAEGPPEMAMGPAVSLKIAISAGGYRQKWRVVMAMYMAKNGLGDDPILSWRQDHLHSMREAIQDHHRHNESRRIGWRH